MKATHAPETLVSVGLPVRNGAQTLRGVVSSVLAQDHERLELVISDNASTDDTEELCRELAQDDSRIVYHRQPRNIGLLNNFIFAMRAAKGTFFRWIGDTDRLAPNYVSRCLEAFAEDSRLILVTTQIRYIGPDGASRTYPYFGTALRSDDPVERFCGFLQSGMELDPMYALLRRHSVASIRRHNMIIEDEVYATKLAMAGPWGHVPEVLADRHYEPTRLSATARKLGVPAWQAYFSTTLQCRAMLRLISDTELTPTQRRRARAAVARMYVDRHYRRITHRGRRLFRLLVPTNATDRNQSNDRPPKRDSTTSG
jgi:glycosyltransferase involved in cell wall biosynthesis